MAKPTVVASVEVIAQGAQLEISFDDGTTFDLLLGVETIPKIGVDASFFEVDAIHETVKRFKAGIKTPPAFELAFRRIGDDTVQDALIAAADSGSSMIARVTYQTGDIWEVPVELGASYIAEAARGDNVQMAGVMGQQTGLPTKTKVV